MQVLIKPEFLVALRGKSKLSPDEAALRLGIDQSDYSIFETYPLEVDIEFADKVASVFRHNWSVFLLESPPHSDDHGQDNRSSNHKRVQLTSNTVVALDDATHRLSILNLIESLPKLQLPSYHNGESAIESAKKLREAVGVSISEQLGIRSNDLLKFWIDKLYVMGIFTSKYPLKESDKIRAFSITKNDNAVIVLSTNDTPKGQTFSLIHELSHVYMRTSGICDLHVSRRSDIESFCNEVASNFLVPPEDFDEYVGTVEIDEENVKDLASKVARKFKVSRLAVYTRMRQKNLIDQNLYSRLYVEEFNRFHPSEGTGGLYYNTAQARNGLNYSAEIYTAVNRGDLTIFQGAKALQINPAILDGYKSRVVTGE